MKGDIVMQTGFVMVNYNDFEHIQKMIAMIKTYKMIDKIVIVDNGSTDGSLNQLKQLENEKIVVLESGHNGGYGAGINIGAKYLNQLYDSCYIIVSNTDILIYNERDIEILLNTFHQNTAVVAPIVKEHTGYNCGWNVPSPWQDIFLSIPGFCKWYQKKMHYPIEKVNHNIIEVEAVSGSFFCIKGHVLESIGYFDENVFLYYEENILSKKIQKTNMNIVINGNVEVFHNHSVTIDKVHTNIQKYKNLKRSQYYFQTKYNHAGFLNQITMKLVFKIVEWGLQIRNRKNMKKSYYL